MAETQSQIISNGYVILLIFSVLCFVIQAVQLIRCCCRGRAKHDRGGVSLARRILRVPHYVKVFLRGARDGLRAYNEGHNAGTLDSRLEAGEAQMGADESQLREPFPRRNRTRSWPGCASMSLPSGRSWASASSITLQSFSVDQCPPSSPLSLASMAEGQTTAVAKQQNPGRNNSESNHSSE
jgi:hypothetical protein